MSLLQINKPNFHITLAFLIIVLLSSNMHVQAENADKRNMAHALWEEGKNAFYESEYQTAFEKFNNSLTLYKEIGDLQSEADILTWMAVVNVDTEMLVDAHNCLKKSQEIYDKLNSRPGKNAAIKDVDKAMKAQMLFAEGKSFKKAKDYKTALEKYHDALKLVREMGEVRYEIGLLLLISTVYAKLGDDERSTKHYSMAHSKGEMFGLNLIKQGNKYYKQGNYSNALLEYKHALTILKRLGSLRSRAQANEMIAWSYIYLKDYQKALERKQRALEIYKIAGENFYQFEKAVVVSSIGSIYGSLKDYKNALEYNQQALKVFKELGNIRFISSTLIALGRTHNDMKDYDKAIKHFQESLDLSIKHNDLEGQGDSLAWIGCVLSQSKSEVIKAGEYYLEALEKHIACDNKEGEAEDYFQLGCIKYNLKKYNEAEEYYTKFLNLSKSLNLNNSKKISVAHRGLASVFMLFGDYAKVIAQYQKSLKINQDSQDRSEEVINDLESIAMSYACLENYPKALEYYQYALKIAKENGYIDKEKILLDMSNYVSMLLSLNSAEFQTPLESEWSVISDAKESGDKKKEVDGYWQLGKIYCGMKDLDKSLKYYKHTLILGEELLKKRDVLAIYEQIGDVFFSKSDFSDALENYQRALEIGISLGNANWLDKLSVGDIHAAIGLMYSCLGNRSKAISHIKEAIKIHKALHSKDRLMRVYRRTGAIYRNLGDYSQALDYQQKALKMAKELKSPFEEIIVLKETGTTYARLNDSLNSMNYYQEALVIAEEMNFRLEQFELLVYIGLTCELNSLKKNSLPFREKAVSYLKKAIDLIEHSRGEIKLEEDRNSFFENKLSIYKALIEILLELGKDEEAFDYLERSKSRAFIDLLGNRKKLQKSRDREAHQEVRKHQLKINILLSQVQSEQQKNEKLDRTILKKQYGLLEEARKEYAGLVLKIKRKNPELSSLVSVNSLTIEEVQNLLPPDTTLLEYFIFTGGVAIWIIDSAKYECTTKFIKHFDLDARITAFRNKIKDLKPSYVEEAEYLYDILIRPAKPYIKTKRICIVPHLVLHYLPFQALINAGERKNKSGSQPLFLIEEYDISYAPSASVLKFVLEKRKKVTGKVLAFGNPELGDEDLNLPHAEEEVKNIKENYPETDLYLNENATEEKAKLLSGNYNIIHFASHGELNPQSPLFSCIKMAKGKDEDGRLEVHEIFNLDLENASLVTLSACETGLSKLTNGDELIGLTRGFIYAGTPSIVASLWNVNDKSTSDLMSLFYKNLKTHSKVESLRMAQLEMINGEVGRGIVRGVGGITTSKEGKEKSQTSMTVNGSHPYFWAPFILLGDWK